MSWFFRPSQIFEMAAQFEKKGEEFYTKLAEKTRAPEIKKSFGFLARQEALHNSKFLRMSAEIKDSEVEQEYSTDILSGIQAMFDEYKQAVLNMSRLSEIERFKAEEFLGIALRTEEASINFFEKMREVHTERFAAVLDRIIAEEKDHRKMLVRLQQAI